MRVYYEDGQSAFERGGLGAGLLHHPEQVYIEGDSCRSASADGWPRRATVQDLGLFVYGSLVGKEWGGSCVRAGEDCATGEEG